MNPLATAIKSAVENSFNRASLLANFQIAIERLEFQPDAQSVILGVPLVAGMKWAHGRLDDFDLALQAGEADFIWGYLLPNLKTLRPAIGHARNLAKRGAIGFITHTRNPLVLRHWLRYGCLVKYCAPDGGKRLYGDFRMVSRYFGQASLPQFGV